MKPHKQFIVLASPRHTGRYVTIVFFQCLCPKHNRWMDVRRIFQEVLFLWDFRHFSIPHTPFSSKSSALEPVPLVFRMCFQKIILFFKSLRTGFIIIVHPGYVLASCPSDTLVQRIGKTSVSLISHTINSFIQAGCFTDRFSVFGRRPIVTQDHLPVSIVCEMIDLTALISISLSGL